MSGDDDDKPTVVIDLNALKKQKEAAQQELESMVEDLEFAVGPEEGQKSKAEAKSEPPAPAPEADSVPPEINSDLESEDFAQQFLTNREVEEKAVTPAPKKQSPPAPAKATAAAPVMTIILFDLESTFFQKSLAQFPKSFHVQVAKTLDELNAHLESKKAQVVVFNYDIHPKAVNSLVAQMKKKFQGVKTMIMAKTMAPERIGQHKATAGGAHAYYQFPLDTKKLEAELSKLKSA